MFYFHDCWRKGIFDCLIGHIVMVEKIFSDFLCDVGPSPPPKKKGIVKLQAFLQSVAVREKFVWRFGRSYRSLEVSSLKRL